MENINHYKVSGVAKRGSFLCLIILMAFMAQSSFGQVTLTGVITEKNSKPVPYASIYIIGTSDGTSSDSLGRFSFNTSAKGTQIMGVFCVGYAPDSVRLKRLCSRFMNKLNSVNIGRALLINTGYIM